MKALLTTLVLALWTGECLAETPVVELIAHRGASYDAPENTVAAFKLAWEQGADGAECDIYLTKDGHIIACHDKTTKRTAGIEKFVAESTLKELRLLDVGSWKHASFSGEKMPTFRELLNAVPKDKKIYIEVKSGPEIVPELIRQLKTAKRDPRMTPVICFQPEVIAAVKRTDSNLPAYLLYDTKKVTAEKLIAQARSIGADGVDLKMVPELDQAYADKIHAAGLRLDVWTVNDPVQARRAIELGAKGITTDRPGFLREQLQLDATP